MRAAPRTPPSPSPIGAQIAHLRYNKTDNVQVSEPVGCLAVPAPQRRAGRCGSAAACRGSKAVARGRGRLASKHRGKGFKVIDPHADLPCNNLPETVAGEEVINKAQEDLCLSKAADPSANLRNKK
ncbi:hypothetical protein U9M48_010808 [Paspalum notatum var. saurae]|uniref:Uncharacterized protein n=1 Tax=Paspalum notatum var. saurae TaxID=547442 RepID=A0AAQ3SUD6_PASNO